jgi:hypothetical protein
MYQLADGFIDTQDGRRLDKNLLLEPEEKYNPQGSLYSDFLLITGEFET